MKPIKKPLAALALAVVMMSTLNISPARAEGPFESFLTCAQGCIDKYAQWTWRRSACAADCYLAISGNAVKVVIGMS